ncbi:hypothetical protein EVAR_91813_1 [Eumeta japonica]|uniref:Uncharacterized protein n=1 Tax=Eumeta variegata TaxID=151549 RepID=A0A4C1SUG8_EUMVA|nr:hypothetical protein EVAR_91813_1 [Eumeta japonica]
MFEFSTRKGNLEYGVAFALNVSCPSASDVTLSTAATLPITVPTAPTPVPSMSMEVKDVIYEVSRELELTCDLPRSDGQSVIWSSRPSYGDDDVSYVQLKTRRETSAH